MGEQGGPVNHWKAKPNQEPAGPPTEPISPHPRGGRGENKVCAVDKIIRICKYPI